MFLIISHHTSEPWYATVLRSGRSIRIVFGSALGGCFLDLQPPHVDAPTGGVWTRDGELAPFRNHLAPFGSSRSRIDSHAFVGPDTVCYGHVFLWCARGPASLTPPRATRYYGDLLSDSIAKGLRIQWWSHTMQPVDQPVSLMVWVGFLPKKIEIICRYSCKWAIRYLKGTFSHQWVWLSRFVSSIWHRKTKVKLPSQKHVSSKSIVIYMFELSFPYAPTEESITKHQGNKKYGAYCTIAIWYCLWWYHMVSEHRHSHLQSPSCLDQPPVMAKAVLSFHQLVENSDESFLLDNEARNLWHRKSFDPVGVDWKSFGQFALLIYLGVKRMHRW